MGGLWYACVIQSLKYLINPYDLLLCGEVRIKEKTTIKTHAYHIINYSTLNNEHNWEEISIQLSDQQICASNNYI